jgi:hypothetical protein
MSCPTCDHTMERVAMDVFRRGCFWCPRCGTVWTTSCDETGAWVNRDEPPALVDRCRRFEKIRGIAYLINEWITAGIAEAINKPEDRPQ